MPGYASDSVGFGVGEMILIALGVLARVWAVRTWNRGDPCRDGKEQITMRTDTKPVDLLDKIRTPGGGSKAGRFLWHFLELQVPMGFGALICYLLGRLIPASSSLATAYHPGTFVFAIGDVLFLAVPVVVWMVFRGRGWRHGLELAMAMSVPVAAIMVLGELTAYDYLRWLITAGYPAMSLGMLIYMLYQRDYFAGQARHLAHRLGSEG